MQYFTASSLVLNCIPMRVGFNPKCSKRKAYRACSGSRLQADELFGGNSYANSAESGQTTQNAVSDQAVYSLLSQCTFKS